MTMINNQKTIRFIFLLLEDFSMIAFAAAIEPLRIANRYSSTILYEWIAISENGEAVQCSNQVMVNVDSGFIDSKRNDVILVCGGMNVKKNSTKPVLNWLRKQSRMGGAIGGLCTASYTLALAGLLNNSAATIHWENYDSFKEEFSEINIQKTVFVIDGYRYSAAGGISPIDLQLKIIAKHHGDDVSNWVADQLVYTNFRTDIDQQRLSIPTRIGVRHPKLSAVIKQMEDNIEEPYSPSILAQEVSMSTRQLERLFRRYLERSPKRYYMELRLQRARHYLMQTDMTVINVALACGFTSPSHFSKCYRSHYGITPYRERGQHTEA